MLLFTCCTVYNSAGTTVHTLLVQATILFWNKVYLNKGMYTCLMTELIKNDRWSLQNT